MGSTDTQIVITDLTVDFQGPSEEHVGYDFDPVEWYRLEKDLHLHAIKQSAWLYLRRKSIGELDADDLIVTAVHTGEEPSLHSGVWERRPARIWLKRETLTSAGSKAITDINVLFGSDAVDPRPGWSLLQTSLSLHAPSDVPGARLSLLRGRPQLSASPPILKANQDGSFKILQISDFHMVAGPGICRDSIDADGNPLPPREADPATVAFVEELLEIEKPDLVVVTGDQLDEMCKDAQTGLLKAVAPMVRRQIPFAVVFGNHDDEGAFSLSRSKQMALLQSLPSNLSTSGPSEIDGIGNYTLPIHHHNSNTPFATLLLLDSHGSVPTKNKSPDYAHITQSQTSWLLDQTTTSLPNPKRMLLSFFHIPTPEFAAAKIYAGTRREPTEASSFNSNFYAALKKAGVLAVGTGHDHGNDFCGLVDGERPWLCYDGAAGFGGYGEYGGKRFHRRGMVWELNDGRKEVRTWIRKEYEAQRQGEILLVRDGEVVVPI